MGEVERGGGFLKPCTQVMVVLLDVEKDGEKDDPRLVN